MATTISKLFSVSIEVEMRVKKDKPVKKKIGQPLKRGERGVQFSVYFPVSFLESFLERVKEEGKNRNDVLYELVKGYMR